MKMNKSSFRVMPPTDISPTKEKIKDSLHYELDHYNSARKGSFHHGASQKQSLSKSVFGYDISP